MSELYAVVVSEVSKTIWYMFPGVCSYELRTNWAIAVPRSIIATKATAKQPRTIVFSNMIGLPTYA